MAKGRKLTQKEFESRAKIIGISIGVVGVSYLSYTMYKNWKDKQDTKQHDKYLLPNGVNVQQVAIGIYDAFYGYAFGMVEDEQEAIRQLQRVPKEYIKQLALVYNKLYDENLYEDFRRYLANDEYKRVENLLQ